MQEPVYYGPDVAAALETTRWSGWVLEARSAR
jgi:hypothetical protein